jgi:hypothetical protein
MKVVDEGNILRVRDSFSATPGSRKPHEGEFSGEEFRISVLLPAVVSAINSKTPLVVDLDGTAGYGTSFLEEAFGGLIRDDRIDYNSLKKILSIKSDEESYLKEDIQSYLKDAYEAQLST